MSDPASATVAPEVTHAPANRGLKAVVILLGALIIIAFGLLVVGALTRFNAKSSSHTATVNNTIALPAGSQIESSEVQADRLILRVQSGAGDEIYIVDTTNGHLVGRIQAAAPAVPGR
ncbi:MAG TPA: DUF6476 family protein [Rhizomicrobium sp.]|nr:DUF6476 family protein [Rhizomicrobium sp.]